MSASDRAQKRLLFLEKTVGEGSTDKLALYGLAMEYKGLGRVDDALGIFGKLRDVHPDYVAMYLMCGEMLIKASRVDDGRAWLEAGLAMARKVGDSHAAGEIDAALAAL